MVNLVLAESNELIRIGLRTVFKQSDITIVGEAECSEELIDQVKSFHPDAVLIDYTSHGFSIDVIPEALQVNPNLKFIAITPDQSANTIINALKSGVISHIKKDCSLDEILNSVIETSQGSTFFCGQILNTIRQEGIDVNELKEFEFSCEPIVLSDREIEIMTLIAEGLTNGQISEKLFLSKHTVNTHRKNIMSKLGVKNTAGIVMYAIKENYTSPNKFLFSNEN